MDENTLKIIKDKFDSLPESIQTLIMSSKYQESLSAISRKYQLSFEQTTILEKETTLVLMGLSTVEDFGNILKEELRVEDLRNSQIVIDIDNQIFSNVETLLKLMYTPEGEEPDLGEEELEENTSLTPNIAKQDNTKIIDPVPLKPTVETTYSNKINRETTLKSNDVLKELSPDIKEAIDKSDYTTALYSISQKHKLNVPQMGVLEEAVKEVMTGKMHPDKFGYYLQQNLKLSVEENTNLVNEINENIFKPIRENMMLSFDRNIETDTEKNNNDDILKKAGINLLSQPEETTEKIPSTEEREEILSKVEHPDNVQKEPTTNTQSTPQKPTNSQPLLERAGNVDPYRMPIE